MDSQWRGRCRPTDYLTKQRKEESCGDHVLCISCEKKNLFTICFHCLKARVPIKHRFRCMSYKDTYTHILYVHTRTHHTLHTTQNTHTCIYHTTNMHTLHISHTILSILSKHIAPTHTCTYHTHIQPSLYLPASVLPASPAEPKVHPVPSSTCSKASRTASLHM